MYPRPRHAGGGQRSAWPSFRTQLSAPSSAAALLALAWACSHPPAQEPQTPPALSSPYPHLPLSSYLPSVGASYAVHLRPSALLSRPEVAESVAAFVSEDRLRAFERVTGVDPRKVEEAWYVAYELGGLLLISSGPYEASVQLAFQRRATGLKRRSPVDERLVHWVGVSEGSPAALLILRGHFIAMSFGDPTLIKLTRGYVEGKLKRTPPLLRSRFLREAALGIEEHSSALLWQGPLSGEDRILYGMLAGVARLETGPQTLDVRVDAYGAWDGLSGSDWLSFCQARLDAPELRALGVERLEDRLSGDCATPRPHETQGAAPLEHCHANLSMERKLVLDRWLRLILGRLADLGGSDESPRVTQE